MMRIVGPPLTDADVGSKVCGVGIPRGYRVLSVYSGGAEIGPAPLTLRLRWAFRALRWRLRRLP